MADFVEMLSAVFRQNPDKVALVSGESRWSYESLARAARQRADEWLRSGVIAGERILILPGNRAESLIAVLAASIGGFDLASPSERASPQEISAIRDITGNVFSWAGVDVSVPADDAEQERDSAWGFRNISIIFFTSGTTSQPKGVSHDLETLLANACAFNRQVDLGENVRMLHVMPVGYMAGLLNTFLSPLMAGGTVILCDAFSARAALSFWPTVLENSVNAMWLSPTMTVAVTQLCRDDSVPAWTRRNLHRVFVGTAPLHPATAHAFRDKFGVECLESYGMTECMFVAVKPPGDANLHHTVGLLLDGVEAQIRGPDGAPLTPGSEGQLWIRSCYASRGYLRDASDVEVFPPIAGGWLDTGDIGVIDSEGYLSITGRIKDLVIRGGINVSPKAVEDAIFAFGGIEDAAVVGLPHPFWGEEVVAFVSMVDRAPLDAVALSAHCSSLLSADAVPSRFIRLDELPRSGNGKVQKHVLRQLGATFRHDGAESAAPSRLVAANDGMAG